MRGRRRVVWVTVLAVALASVWAASGAAADQVCRDVAVSPGERLVSRGPTKLGPMRLELPAGRYRILMTSADNGHEAGYQVDQTHERWSFRLDSGYRSPITPDLAETAKVATFDMGTVDLKATWTITFRHHGAAPVADSVVPSVLFVCDDGPVSTAPPTTLAPSTSGPASTAPLTTGPLTTGPQTTGPQTTAPQTTGGATSEPLITTDATLDPTTSTTEAPVTTAGTAESMQPPGADRSDEPRDPLPATGSNGGPLVVGVLLLASGGVLLVIGKLLSVEVAHRTNE